MKDNIKKYKSYIIIAVIVLLIIVIGFTAAYFQAQVGSGATANVTVTTKTTDTLTFNKGNDINITATQANFGSGAGNRTGSTTATASLLANNDTNSATNTYNVYLYIQSNNFEYTTSPTNTPELLLTITNPNNQAVTSLTGLTYTASGGVSGFDITTKRGLIQIASDYTITSTGTKTDTWNITVTLINLNSDQQSNTGKTFTGQVIIQKGVYEVPVFTGNIYRYSDEWSRSGQSIVPLTGTKYVITDGNNIDSDYYYDDDLACQDAVIYYGEDWYCDLQTGVFGGLSSGFEYDADEIERDFYIKHEVLNNLITASEACLYYNNHEFCLGANYWEGTILVDDTASGIATKNKLQAEMETALGTSATDCDSFSRNAWCNFGDFYCNADYVGNVGCGSNVVYSICEVDYSRGARCILD